MLRLKICDFDGQTLDHFYDVYLSVLTYRMKQNQRITEKKSACWVCKYNAIRSVTCGLDEINVYWKPMHM